MHVPHAGQAGVPLHRNGARLGIAACLILRHYPETNQEDGGVEWKKFWYHMCQRNDIRDLFHPNEGPLELLKNMFDATEKSRYQVCFDSGSPFTFKVVSLFTEDYLESRDVPVYIRATQGHSANPLTRK